MTALAQPEELLEEEHDAEPPLRPKRRVSDDEMDITPMIDITFLLLIFFIVSSVTDKQTAIELPHGQHGRAVSQLKSVVFTVGDGGIDLAPVYLGDGKVPAKQLSNNLEERNGQIEGYVEEGFRSNKPSVVIKADKSVRFRDVDRVIKAVSRVSGVEIHLAILEDR